MSPLAQKFKTIGFTAGMWKLYVIKGYNLSLSSYMPNTDLKDARAWWYDLTPKAEGYITRPWQPEGLYWVYDSARKRL